MVSEGQFLGLDWNRKLIINTTPEIYNSGITGTSSDLSRKVWVTAHKDDPHPFSDNYSRKKLFN